MLKISLALIVALTLTACVPAAGTVTAGSAADAGSTGTTSAAATSSTEDQLQGSWHRVGQYCGATYSTGLPVLHATFTTTQLTIGMSFNCDNQVHIAQYYDVRYDHNTVQVEMTQTASSSCPMVYGSAGSPGWENYTANILNDSGSLTLELTVGTCAGNQAQKDVYQKD